MFSLKKGLVFGLIAMTTIAHAEFGCPNIELIQQKGFTAYQDKGYVFKVFTKDYYQTNHQWTFASFATKADGSDQTSILKKLNSLVSGMQFHTSGYDDTRTFVCLYTLSDGRSAWLSA